MTNLNLQQKKALANTIEYLRNNNIGTTKVTLEKGYDKSLLATLKIADSKNTITANLDDNEEIKGIAYSLGYRFKSYNLKIEELKDFNKKWSYRIYFI